MKDIKHTVMEPTNTDNRKYKAIENQSVVHEKRENNFYRCENSK